MLKNSQNHTICFTFISRFSSLMQKKGTITAPFILLSYSLSFIKKVFNDKFPILAFHANYFGKVLDVW